MYNAVMVSAPLDQLHDATLVAIQLDWDTGECVATFRGAPNIPGGSFRLRWTHVSDLHVPRALAWGPSMSVLSAVEHPGGRYALHLQSGDVITVQAEAVALER
jgi:hypothetical protein